MLLHMNMYEFICNIYEFLNLVGSYDPCYDPPIHDLIGVIRSYLGSRVCLPCYIICFNSTMLYEMKQTHKMLKLRIWF
jgi:hypothetical protein